MRIAIFHELIDQSGAKKAVQEYGKILKKKHQVDLYYVDNQEDKNILKDFNKINYFKFKETKWQGNNWQNKLYKDTAELVKLYLLHKKIGKIINEKKYNLIMVNPSKFTQAPFILRALKGNVVYYCQEPLRFVYEDFFKISSSLPLPKKLYEKLNRFNRKLIDKLNVRKAFLILANSNYTKKYIERVYGRKAIVCYLGVDKNRYRPLKLKEEYDAIFVGQKSETEGYDLLEKCLGFYRNQPIIKYVSGRDEGKGIMEDELVKEYNKAKLALVLSRNEPFGLTPLEAMACGIPVIAIKEGGFKESVKDGLTGFLILRNKTELKKKLDELLKNTAKRQKMGNYAREYVVNNFTWEKSVNHFLKIVQDNFNIK